MKNLRWAVPVLIVIVLPFGLMTACGSDEEANDAPRSDINDTTEAAILAFPDTFGNLAAKCFGTDMVYSTRNDTGRGVAISPNHPWCADGVLTRDEWDR